MRDLTTCEQRGIVIEHRRLKFTCVIVGSYQGGFRIYCDDGEIRGLPFERVDEYRVLEDSDLEQGRI